MVRYQTYFTTERLKIAPVGGSQKASIPSNGANAVYFQVCFADTPGSVPGTGPTLDFILKTVEPRINKIPVMPFLVGDGNFSSPEAEQEGGRNFQMLSFESPDPYGVVEERFEFECNVGVGYAVPLDIVVIRRMIKFL